MAQVQDVAGPAADKLPRGSHGLPIEFVIRSQRERLFAGMARVMARCGYAATTVDDIAVESGVSRKALYAHFSGKEDVLLQAHRAVTERIRAGAGPVVIEQSDWKAAVRALFEWTLEFFAREPAFAHMVFVEMAAATPASRKLQRESFAAMRDLVKRMIAAGEQPVSPTAIDGMLGGLAYVISKAAEEGEPSDLRSMTPELITWVVLVLEGPAAAEQELARDLTASPNA